MGGRKRTRSDFITEINDIKNKRWSERNDLITKRIELYASNLGLSINRFIRVSESKKDLIVGFVLNHKENKPIHFHPDDFDLKVPNQKIEILEHGTNKEKVFDLLSQDVNLYTACNLLGINRMSFISKLSNEEKITANWYRALFSDGTNIKMKHDKSN